MSYDRFSVKLLSICNALPNYGNLIQIYIALGTCGS